MEETNNINEKNNIKINFHKKLLRFLKIRFHKVEF